MQALGRAADFAPVVNNVDEIANLPWFGNFASDQPLFAAIDDFIFNRAETVEVAVKALYLLGDYGMGITDQVTAQDLKQYIDEAERKPVHFTL